uniref:Uncharacterized protein n=1 Tax=Anguilla anguilla TaxID=7936 RepID=A0A0E9QA96_ANGAN
MRFKYTQTSSSLYIPDTGHLQTFIHRPSKNTVENSLTKLE